MDVIDRRVVVGLLAGAVLGAALLVSPGAVLEPVAALADDPVAFGVAVLALYLVRPFLAVPTTACALVVGYGYGLYGVPVAVAGAALTALPPYYVGRWTVEADHDDPGPVAGRLVGSAGRLREAGERFFETTGGVRGVVVARLVPIPADVVSGAAGTMGVRARALVVGTAIGETPWTVGAVLVGASAGRLTNVGDPAGVGLPVVAVALLGAALLLVGPAYRLLGADRSTG